MNRWLKYAVKCARGHTEFPGKYKMSAVMIRGGRVVSVGLNQTAERRNASTHVPKAPEYMGIHAEVDCLIRAPYEQIGGSVVYVAGIKPSGRIGMSKPCSLCLQALKDSGVKKIVWVSRGGTSAWERINVE